MRVPPPPFPLSSFVLARSALTRISKYCWFGAVRDPYNLHGVHPSNRLMDEQGNITALYVLCSLRRSYRSHGQISLMTDLGAINTLVVGMHELSPNAEPSVQTQRTKLRSYVSYWRSSF
jgi:hypothetical protein